MCTQIVILHDFFKAKLSFIFLLYRGTTMRSEMKKSSKASGLKSEDKCLGLWFNYQKKRGKNAAQPIAENALE